MSVSPFQSGHKEALPRILGVSMAFHLAVIIAIVVASWSFKEPPRPIIPVFELVNVEQPARPRASRPRPPPPPVTEDLPKPEPKPVVKPDLKPEIKPKVDPKPQPKPEVKPKVDAKPDPKPVEKAVEEPAPPDDMPMDLPTFSDMPALRPVGMVDMDPLLQVYLERVVAILMQNFNPPSGTEVRRGTKTSVQFTIERTGEITGIVLRNSSGNAVWDRLSVRAVNLAKVPPLPPNYRAPVLPLVFDFREK
jgi:periplasmic protein TonB